MREIGLDIHLDFCEVAIAEAGEIRSAGRIPTTPDRIELFAQSLGPDDRVALEVTGNAWEIKRLLEPHVAEVIVVSPNDTGIRSARAKTDRLDARTQPLQQRLQLRSAAQPPRRPVPAAAGTTRLLRPDYLPPRGEKGNDEDGREPRAALRGAGALGAADRPLRPDPAGPAGVPRAAAYRD
jgi:hypothetical protein